MNNVTLTGRFVRDPELSYTASGTAVSNFSLAVELRRVKKGETWESKTAFIDFVAWGQSAEKLTEKYKKGDLLEVVGSLDEDQWTDKETQKPRRKLRVMVDKFNNVPGVKYKRGEEEAATAGVSSEGSAQAGEDDIPF